MNTLNPSTILNASNANIKFNLLFRKYSAVYIDTISSLFKYNTYYHSLVDVSKRLMIKYSICIHSTLLTMGDLAYIF